jgi:hypothetical protein
MIATDDEPAADITCTVNGGRVRARVPLRISLVDWLRHGLELTGSHVSGESLEGKANYRDHIVRRGDVSADGLKEKARFVLGEMERRMQVLGFGWKNTTATQVYRVHDLHPFLAEEIVRRGAARAGLTWHFNRPPVVELEYEMDCRGVHREEVATA